MSTMHFNFRNKTTGYLLELDIGKRKLYLIQLLRIISYVIMGIIFIVPSYFLSLNTNTIIIIVIGVFLFDILIHVFDRLGFIEDRLTLSDEIHSILSIPILKTILNKEDMHFRTGILYAVNKTFDTYICKLIKNY
jgi:hypothetical protein